jgi:hypothetical protein
MSDLNELLKRASAKQGKQIQPIKRDFGLKKTMALMSQDSIPTSPSLRSPDTSISDKKISLTQDKPETNSRQDEVQSIEPVVESVSQHIFKAPERPPEVLIAEGRLTHANIQPEPIKEAKSNLKTNIRQTQDIYESNSRQTQDRLDFEEFNLGQTQDKKAESQDKLKTQLETNSGHKLKTNVRQTQDDLETVSRHIKDKPKTISDSNIRKLGGLQKNILNVLLEICKIQGSRETGPVTTEYLAQSVGAAPLSIPKTVQRMEHSGFIERADFKPGRDGWTSYEIPGSVYQQLIHSETQDKLRTNLRHNLLQPKTNQRQNEAIPKTQLETEPKTSASSSKIDVFLKNNLSDYLSENTKPEPWFLELDFSKVYPIKAINVNVRIRELAQAMLSKEQVQNFLDRYKSWLATQDISKVNSQIALFCEKLKDFATIKQSDVEDCLTEDERLVEVQMASEMTKARAELDLISKAKAEQFTKEMSEKINREFDEWLISATEEDQIALSNPSGLAPLGSDYYKTALRAAYAEKVFKGN